MYFKHVRCNEEQQKDTFSTLRSHYELSILQSNSGEGEEKRGRSEQQFFRTGRDLLNDIILKILFNVVLSINPLKIL